MINLQKVGGEYRYDTTISDPSINGISPLSNGGYSVIFGDSYYQAFGSNGIASSKASIPVQTDFSIIGAHTGPNSTTIIASDRYGGYDSASQSYLQNALNVFTIDSNGNTSGRYSVNYAGYDGSGGHYEDPGFDASSTTGQSAVIYTSGSGGAQQRYVDLFGADGNRISHTVVDDDVRNDGVSTKLLALADGRYLGVWQELHYTGSLDASGARLFDRVDFVGQLIGSDGSLVGARTNFQSTPFAAVGNAGSVSYNIEIASTSSNGFVLSNAIDTYYLNDEKHYAVAAIWQFDGIGRISKNADITIPITGSGSRFDKITALHDGRILETYYANTKDAGHVVLKGQVYDSAGAPVSSELTFYDYKTAVTSSQFADSFYGVYELSNGNLIVNYTIDVFDISNLTSLIDFNVIQQYKLVDKTSPSMSDFGGDGRADFLWRNGDGSLTTWTSKGDGTVGYGSIQKISTSWHVQGTGDFNGDGRADILWQNTNGSITTWTSNGDATVTYGAVQQVASSWHAQHVADLDGNGRADIVWRNDDGNVTTWTTNNDGTIKFGAVQQVATSWQVKDTGDFNGDGRDDVLWQNTNGSLTTWMTKNDGTFDYGAVQQVASTWHAGKAGDFNGDGRDDILWRNDDGSLTTWLKKTDGTVDYGAVFKVGTDWHVQETGDYNGDGRDDVLWRNDNGTVVIWDSTGNGGSNAFASHEVAKVGTDWQIVA